MLSNAVEVESKLNPAFLALLWAGQMLLRLAAKEGFSEGSTSWLASKLWILFWKEEQWEKPRVCPPACEREYRGDVGHFQKAVSQLRFDADSH